MRPEIEHLIALGPLPDEVATAETIARYQDALHAIPEPVTDDEAVALVACFGPDECFRLAWTLLHKIETAPGWPLDRALADDQNGWVALLRDRT